MHLVLLLGRHTPEHCPAGTWSSTTGLTQESDCTECPAGRYCQQTALTAPEGPCTEGYYCEAGELLILAKKRCFM